MSLSADAVTRILEGRFDWYSARVTLKAAAERAGLSAAGPFDAKALEDLADAVALVATQTDAVAAALRAAGHPKHAAKASAAPAPAHEPTTREVAAAAHDAPDHGPVVIDETSPAAEAAQATEGTEGIDAKRDAAKKKK